MEAVGRPLSKIHYKGDSLLEIGDMIEVFSENDPHLMYTESRWNKSYGQQSLAQIITITNITEEGISIDTPLRLNYYLELNPRIRKITPVENAGVENLSIERIDPSTDSAIGFENALNSWVKDCKSYMASRGHIWVNHSRFITVQGTEVSHGFNYGSGGNGYGMVAGNMAVDCLYIDNILHDLRHSMMAKKGSNGNVFAYNYSHTRRRTPLDKPLICDISLHGHYPYQNLFEGNIVEYIDIADHWGPIGPDTTFFRNQVLTYIKVRDHSHHMRIIGNVLIEGTIQPNITVHHTSLLENITLSKPDHKDPTDEAPLPASIYFTQKPDFWGDLPWPSIGPGTDLTQKIRIPAPKRAL